MGGDEGADGPCCPPSTHPTELEGAMGATRCHPKTLSSQFSHLKAQGITHRGGRCQLSSSPPPLFCSQISCFEMASNVVLSPRSTVGACPVPATPSQPDPGRPLVEIPQCWGCTAEEKLDMGHWVHREHPSAEQHLPWHGQGSGREIPPVHPPDSPAPPRAAPAASLLV